MSKSIIAGILKNIELSPKAEQEILAGVPSSSQVKAELCDRVWSVVPAQLKTLTGGDRRVLFERNGKKELLSLKAQADDLLLHLIALHDPEVIKANLLAARNDFYLLCTSVTGGLALSNMKSVSDPEMCDGIAFAADGRAVYWKQAPKGFVVDAVHGKDTTQIKTTVAEFRLKPGILAGVDQVSLQLLADQTGTTVRQLQRMDRSKDHKVLSELALRVIAVLDVFKLENERQATFDELLVSVKALGVPQGAAGAADVDPNVEQDQNRHKKIAEYFKSKGIDYEALGDDSAAQDALMHEHSEDVENYIKAAAVAKDIDPKGEQAKPPTDKDHLSELLDDKKRPAVVIDKEPSKDPLKPKESLYSAKEVSLKDLQKPDAGFALAVWCVTMEEAKAKAKDLESRRADYMPLPDHWVPPASEAAGEGVEEKKSELNDGKVMKVKEIKKPSSPQALDPKDVKEQETTREALAKVRRGEVMAFKIKSEVSENPDVQVENHGSVAIMHFYTPEAKAWQQENIGEVESWQKVGSTGISVEPRYVQDIINGLEEAGLKVAAKKVKAGGFTVADIDELAKKMQKENPDLAWDDATDAAYRQLADKSPSGWVDQDRKPVSVEDLEKGKKMGKERRDAAEAFDKEFLKKGVKAADEAEESWDTGEVGLWINNDEGLYNAARGAYDGRSLETKVKELMESIPDIKVDWLQVDWDAVYRDTVGADDEVQARLKARARRILASRKFKASTDESPDSEDIDGCDVRVYDSGDETFDRYTIVIENPVTLEQSWLGSSKDPFFPTGFGQHLGDQASGYQDGEHLGKRIKFAELPEQVQKFVRQDTKVMAPTPEQLKEAGIEAGLTAAPKKDKKKPPAQEPKKAPELKDDDEPATDDDEFEAKARQALAKSLGVEPGDLKKGEARFPYDEGGHEAAYFENGSEEYTVFAEDDAEDFARSMVRNDFDEHGEGFDIYDQDFLMGHVDREALHEFMEQVFREWAENDVNELDEDEKESWLSDKGFLPEPAEGAEEPDVDALFEARRDEWVEERVSDNLGNDHGEGYWRGNIGDKDFMDLVKKEGLFDIDDIVEEAVSLDGAGHFLSVYDGELHDIGDGLVYARWN